ncbi:MAG: hypothetical protein K0M48_14330 [Thiobacillus sp.]|nr:hypothetical protein [Thiobacillus sp.]
MTSTNFLRAALLTSIFAASAMMAPANADIIKRDEYGFEARKFCTDDDIIRAIHLDDPKTELMSQAQSAEWNMELYVNKQTNYWVLLGKSRDPGGYPGETCVLSVGKLSPYQREKWHALFFEKMRSQK